MKGFLFSVLLLIGLVAHGVAPFPDRDIGSVGIENVYSPDASIEIEAIDIPAVNYIPGAMIDYITCSTVLLCDNRSIACPAITGTASGNLTFNRYNCKYVSTKKGTGGYYLARSKLSDS